MMCFVNGLYLSSVRLILKYIIVNCLFLVVYLLIWIGIVREIIIDIEFLNI